MRQHLHKLKFIIPFILLGWVLSRVDVAVMGEVIKDARWDLVFCVLALEVLSLYLQGWRLHILLCSDGKKRPLLRTLNVNFLATFFDTFVPGRLGSDTWRAVKLRENKNTSHLVSTLLAMRLQGACVFLIVFGFFAVLYTPSTSNYIALVAAGLLFIFFIARYIIEILCRLSGKVADTFESYRKIDTFLQSASESFLHVFSSPGRFIFSSAINITFALVCCFSFAVAGASLGAHLPIQAYLLGVPALMVISVIPITIQGRGSTELVALYIWQGYGVSNEQLVLICLVPYAASLCYSLFAGLVLGGKTILNR